MPDLRREARLREAWNLDERATFTVDTGGTRDQQGHYVPNLVTWTAWVRREVLSADEGLSVTDAGHFRQTASIKLAARHDPRLVEHGPGGTVAFDGTTYSIAVVARVGRRRYVYVYGSAST